eukprot:gene14030-biopygen18604
MAPQAPGTFSGGRVCFFKFYRVGRAGTRPRPFLPAVWLQSGTPRFCSEDAPGASLATAAAAAARVPPPPQ